MMCAILLIFGQADKVSPKLKIVEAYNEQDHIIPTQTLEISSLGKIPNRLSDSSIAPMSKLKFLSNA